MQHEQSGDPDTAIRLYREIADTNVPDAGATRVHAVERLFEVHFARDETAAAQTLYERALEIRRRVLPPGHDTTLQRSATSLRSTPRISARRKSCWRKSSAPCVASARRDASSLARDQGTRCSLAGAKLFSESGKMTRRARLQK
ncbi:MAG TPA: tetratricopeptide repeat protein [Thermoanaerobaculia bacterium]